MKTLKVASVFTLVLLGCSRESNQIVVPKDMSGSLKILENSISDVGKILSFEFASEDNNHRLKIESSQKGNRLHSKLKYKQSGQAWEDLSTIDLDLGKANYRAAMSVVVEDYADALKSAKSLADIDTPELLLANAPKALYEKLSKDDYYTELAQTTLYHWGILKAAKRAYRSNKEDCQCTNYDPYIGGESPFFCFEDMMIDADKLSVFFKDMFKNRDFEGQKFVPKQTLAYLKTKTQNVVSASNVDYVLNQEFDLFWEKLPEAKKAVILNRAGVEHYRRRQNTANTIYEVDPDCIKYEVQNSDQCGCCGNDGPYVLCKNCSWICNWHDRACVGCGDNFLGGYVTGWMCGPKCKPGCGGYNLPL